MAEDIYMKSEVLTTKNVCLFIGVLLSGLTVFDYLLIFPGCLLLLIGGILSFEITKKRKKLFEDLINYKLEQYEEEHKQLKKEFDKIKSDFESIRMRQGVSSTYGKLP